MIGLAGFPRISSNEDVIDYPHGVFPVPDLFASRGIGPGVDSTGKQFRLGAFPLRK